MRLFVLAGEPSGDRLAAALVRDLRTRAAVELSGVGGPLLAAEGQRTLFAMSELAVMGGADVARALPRLLARVRHVSDAILSTAPDVVLLVDAQAFSERVASRLRRRRYARPILLYVAPAVWAHGKGRARRLSHTLDEILAVLPFEPEVMAHLGGPPTCYVGHPAADAPAPRPTIERDTLLLLPGSRAGELRRHLPAFRSATEAIAAIHSTMRLVLLTLPHLADTLRAETAGWRAPITIVSDDESRAGEFARARLAITKSGTATLELALAGVPMLIAYALDGFQALVYARKGRPPVGLPNIIIGEPIGPELVARRLDGKAMARTALRLLDDEEALALQRAAYARLRDLMERGLPDWPRQQPADRVLAHWAGSQRAPTAT